MPSSRPPLAELMSGAALAQAVRALQRRFNQRKPRERGLLIATAIALALMLADTLWLSPALTGFQAARLQQANAVQALAGLQVNLQLLQQRQQTQAQVRQAELSHWRQRVRDGDSQLRSHESTLVGSDRMVELLEQLLARHGELRVRAMRSLGRGDLLAQSGPTATGTAQAAGPAATADVEPAAPAAATLYRHGVELELEGGFADLLAWLQAMEALPQRVLWGSVNLKVMQHPRSVLTLRVYTLSRDRHWLEI